DVGEDSSFALTGMSLYGNYLAVGSEDGQGGDDANGEGEVYVFSFTNNADTSFSSPTLEGMIGEGHYPTLTVADASDALTAGRTITGGTSGATGVVVAGASESTSVTYTLTSGHFADGETITEATSSYTRTISEIPLYYGAFVAGETITEATSSYTRTIASANGSVKQHKNLATSNVSKSFSEVDIDGNYLVLGSSKSRGGGGAAEVGEAYIYSFTNNSAATQFSEVILEGIVGKGVSGAQSVIARQDTDVGLTSGDRFGMGVALDNNRLVVGAGIGTGKDGLGSRFGEVFIFPISHYEVSDAVFATNASTDNTIWPSTIIGM
ncbi:uncharacterized protein METZ01_LOCUS348112, partial [marine metagenome]